MPGDNSALISVVSGVLASFALVAIDSAGNVSDTAYLKNVVGTAVEKTAAIRQFKAKVIQDQKAILLEWTYDAVENVMFVLYRKSLDSDLTGFVGRFDALTRNHTDRGPSIFRQGFDYYLKAVATDGRESDWAVPLRIRF